MPHILHKTPFHAVDTLWERGPLVHGAGIPVKQKELWDWERLQGVRSESKERIQ